MGIIFGTIELIVGLLLILFPGTMAKIWRIGPRPQFGFKKEKGKWKVGFSPTLEKAFGLKKAKFLVRVLGVIILIVSLITYLSPNAP